MYKDNTSSVLIEKVKTEMFLNGYSERSINRYRACWNAFQKYELSNQYVYFSSETALEFLKDIYGITVSTSLSKQDGIRARAMQFLCEYSQYSRFDFKKKKVKNEVILPFSDVLDKFKEHQMKQHLISPSTQEHYHKVIGRFLLYLQKQKINNLDSITTSIILDYCNTHAPHMKATMHNSFSSLRVFLRYLNKSEYIQSDLSDCIPSVPYKRESKIPTVFSLEEINDIFKCIDRSSPLGKRDYAIILIAYRLGLRSSDIRNLKFSNFHWDKNTIELIMVKTSKEIVLPLLNDIGEAVIDYIKYGRPDCENNLVFVRHIVPIQFITAAGMTAIVKRYVNKAGIDSSPYGRGGPHAMRSTLATVLLENNIPLPAISEILGHSSTRTTEIYLKLDIPQLRRCCLEVPPYDWTKNDKEVF